MNASLVMADWPGVVRGPSGSANEATSSTELFGSSDEQRSHGSISVGSGNGTEIAPWLLNDDMSVSMTVVAFARVASIDKFAIAGRSFTACRFARRNNVRIEEEFHFIS